MNWLWDVIEQLSFTVAGIAITMGFIFTQLHIQFAQGVSSGFFSDHLFGWGVFGVLPVILGRITDFFVKLKEAKEAGKNVVLLGIMQFYLSFVILITSLIGGETSFNAIYKLKKRPWDIFMHDIMIVPYAETYSHTILEGMGSLAFLLFYFFTPLSLVLYGRSELKTIANGGNAELSKNAYWTLILVNIPLLVISLLVGWYEGWIEGVFVMIVVIIGWVLQKLIELYQWLVGFFA